MPIFEYKCNNCGKVIEFLENSGKPQKHQCSKCGSSNLQKMLSGFAVGQNKPSNACDSCFNRPSQAECEGMCGGQCGL
ncbi:MAG: zinc ribbon domain-containing protein [Sedimentisphaerales bacterium]|nr:zinc ribbon domain-containing protein [Sedimentisphaerales bacterium]